MTANERLKFLRKDSLHYSLEKFGERLGVQKSTLSAIENGSTLTDKMVKAICREYGVNEEWLVSGEGEMFAPVDRKTKLLAWADKVLADSPDSFRWKFVSLLTELPDEWWEVLEEKALEIFAEEDPAGAAAIRAERDRISVETNYGAIGNGATVINHNES